MKKLMIGNQAVAAGLHDGGLGVVSSSVVFEPLYCVGVGGVAGASDIGLRLGT